MARFVDLVAIARDPLGASAPKSQQLPVNEPPVVGAILFLDPVSRQPITQVRAGGQALIVIEASDPDSDPLTYELTASEGTIAPTAVPNEFLYTAA